MQLYFGTIIILKVHDLKNSTYIGRVNMEKVSFKNSRYKIQIYLA